MFDVSSADFTTAVIAASKTTPVLVDFWAPWCGPCKSLGPVLEKLETAYGGAFVLAKMNTDENPQIAAQISQMLGVRSIPLCVLFKDGQVADAFVGAVPEVQIREFLDRHVQALAPEAEPQAQELDAQEQLEIWKAELDKDEKNQNARFQLCRALLRSGELQQAAHYLSSAPAQEPADRRLASLAMWLALLQEPSQHNQATLLAQLAANKRDFVARHELACLQIRQGQFTEAMETLLEIIMRDRQWNEDQARKTYVAILDIHDDDAALLDEYRKKLSMVLF